MPAWSSESTVTSPLDSSSDTWRDTELEKLYKSEGQQLRHLHPPRRRTARGGVTEATRASCDICPGRDSDMCRDVTVTCVGT